MSHFPSVYARFLHPGLYYIPSHASKDLIPDSLEINSEEFDAKVIRLVSLAQKLLQRPLRNDEDFREVGIEMNRIMTRSHTLSYDYEIQSSTLVYDWILLERCLEKHGEKIFSRPLISLTPKEFYHLVTEVICTYHLGKTIWRNEAIILFKTLEINSWNEFVVLVKERDPECYELLQKLRESTPMMLGDLLRYKLLGPKKKILEKWIYNPPKPEHIPAALETWTQTILKLLKAKEDPVYIAAKAHMDLIKIRPFIRGNGVMARLWMNVILIQSGVKPAIFYSQKAYLTAVYDAYEDPDSFLRYLRYHLLSIKENIIDLDPEKLRAKEERERLLAILQAFVENHKELFREPLPLAHHPHSLVARTFSIFRNLFFG